MASPTTPAHASEHDDPTQAEVSGKAAKAEAAKAARMAKAAATKAKKAEAKAKADAVALVKKMRPTRNTGTSFVAMTPVRPATPRCLMATSWICALRLMVKQMPAFA